MSSPGHPSPVQRAEPKENYQNFRSRKPNKPHYLQRLPLYKKYPRFFVFGGGILGTLIFYSAPIYYFFRTPPENEPPEYRMWKGEILRGKSYVEQWKERRQQHEEEKAKYLAKQKAMTEAREAAIATIPSSK